MSKSIKSVALASLGAFAFLSVPVLLDRLSPDPLAISKAYAGDKDKGGGSPSKKDKSTSEETSESGSKEKKTSMVATIGDDGTNAALDKGKVKVKVKVKNLNAQLAGLNSLKRNINGLMNSADPKMALIRSFIENSAELAAAEVELTGAKAGLISAQAAYDTYVATLEVIGYADTSPAGLQSRLDSLSKPGPIVGDADYDAVQAEIAVLTDAIAAILASRELSELNLAQAALTKAETAVAEATVGTTDADLIEALMVAANDNRVAEYGDGYVTAELLAWAKSVLGVGEYSGAIDAYIAQQ